MVHRTLAAAMGLFIGLSALPTAATAEDGAGVVVMNFERFDANDKVMKTLSRALEDGIEAHADMYVKPGGGMTIKDLTLTAGCAEPDAACMKTLRDFVDADRVVFGTVTASDDVHLFSMKMFDFAEGQFVFEVADQTVQGDVAHLENVLPAVVEGFLYGDVGTLSVSVSGADSPDLVFDGEKVGVAPTTLENLPLGEHVVAVRNNEGEERTETVILRYAQPAAIDFAFGSAVAEGPTENPPSGGSSVVPSIVTIGLGVAALGFGGFSSLQVKKATDDNKRLGDEGFVDPATGAFVSSDAVANAKAANLDPDEIEKRAKMYQTLQWVGYGAGAVGVGLGVFLLTRAMGSESNDASATLPFDFGVAPRRDGVEASFRLQF